MAFGLPLGLAQEATGGLGLNSGVTDTGVTTSQSVNIVGNVNSNLGEILRFLNEGPLSNGGSPTQTATPFLNMKPLPPTPDRIPTENGLKFNASGLIVGLLVLGGVIVFGKML